jgi:hypothetical protein
MVEHFDDGDRPGRYTNRAPPGIPGLMAGAMLIRRLSFLRLGQFPTDRRLGEFLDWYARATEAGLRYGIMPKVVLRRRVHGENATVMLPRWRSDYSRIPHGIPRPATLVVPT